MPPLHLDDIPQNSTESKPKRYSAQQEKVPRRHAPGASPSGAIGGGGRRGEKVVAARVGLEVGEDVARQYLDSPHHSCDTKKKFSTKGPTTEIHIQGISLNIKKIYSFEDLVPGNSPLNNVHHLDLI
jgi:hypothetical protein